MNYNGKQVLVLGLGESGLAMAQWLHRCGASVRVADTRTVPQRLASLREMLPAVEF
ncbi:MAG: UDP-N-acetylmuramoyl-L-alanine--D-glutamate ligase, partial [Oxalobacteraceae bacterium]